MEGFGCVFGGRERDTRLRFPCYIEGGRWVRRTKRVKDRNNNRVWFYRYS